MRLILKFGGSSLSSIKKIKEVAQFISNLKKRKNLELIIVVSAMGKTTNMLESLANKFDCCKLSSTYGALLTIGENISNYLLCMALEELNINAVSLTCKDIKITASGSVDFGIITHIDKTKIENYLLENKVVIVSGFQGENSHGQIITLGRGGSDTTAVALGHTLNANVKIYTDVNGFYSVNPAQYQNAKLLKNIYIKSAIELANVNAKVLDYRALCLLNQNKTPLTVAKSLSNNSTTVSFKPVENYQIDGISCKNKISFVKNTIKYSHFLQTINQNLNYKNYFYNTY